MTIPAFLDMLRSHLAALRSGLWEHGPALYLDERDTSELIELLEATPREGGSDIREYADAR